MFVTVFGAELRAKQVVQILAWVHEAQSELQEVQVSDVDRGDVPEYPGMQTQPMLVEVLGVAFGSTQVRQVFACVHVAHSK